MSDMVSHAPSAGGVEGVGLEAKFAATLAGLLRTCRNAGYEFRVAQGLRTAQVQAEYYCKWTGHAPSDIDAKVKLLKSKGAPWLSDVLAGYRDIPRTKAKLTGQLPGSGWHQWGLAADAYCYRNGAMVEDGSDPCYKFYADEARKLGLTAGYYFSSRDSGHVQAPSADGADDVYAWSYIDGIMKERFSPKTAIAPSPKPVRSAGQREMAAVAPLAAMEAVASPAISVPPAATKDDISIVGGKVRGPGNIVFGTVKGPGLFNFGVTTLGDFFGQDPHAFPDTPPSLINVIRSVSENEGKIEAINTYDSAFLSVGIFQWTAGAAAAAGEIAGLLDLLKRRSVSAFNTYFGSAGLDITLGAAGAGTLATGYLIVDGRKLDTAAEKEILRQPLWAYRFWRAAHDPEIRRAQVALAMARVDVFYPKIVPGRNGLAVKDFISSEYGVALLLDEHVNRPGHVPKTLMAGVDAFIAAGGKKDPHAWTDGDEAKVLEAYLAARNKTSMTDSQKRAERTAAHAKAGTLSIKRSSFKT